jgi:hypothetical protein
MTGQIADHFAQRKIVATDEFLEGTTGWTHGSNPGGDVLRAGGYEEIDRLFDGLIGDAIGLVIVAVFARSSVCGPAVAVTRTGDQKWGA